VFARDGGHLVHINAAAFPFHAVRDDLEQATGKIHRAAVGQVSAVGKIHAQKDSAGLNRGEIRGHVRLGAGMGLDVGVRAMKKLFRALDGQIFRLVHKGATAVIAFAGIAFGILVGQHRSLRLAHSRGNEVFRGDQLKSACLAGAFTPDGLRQFRILQYQFLHVLFSSR